MSLHLLCRALPRRLALFADNHTQHELLGIHDGQHVRLRDSTLAHDSIDNGYGLYVADSASLDLEDSIIDMPGFATLDLASLPGYQNIVDVLSNDIGTLPASPTIVQGEPSFVDEANGDYHLQATSLGVDFAPPDAAISVDLDDLPRDVDLPLIPNYYGPRDLGAYERQNMFQCGTSNSIFCNGYNYSW